MNYTVGSLFAGVGGICSGFQRASYTTDNGIKNGYDVVWANEIDEDACTTYRLNYKHLLIEGDIEKILDPSIIKKEREALINRATLSENILEENITLFEEDFLKEGTAKSLNNYTANLLKGNPFELTEKLEEKLQEKYEMENISIEYEKYLDIYKKIIEAKVIEKELQEKNIEYLHKELKKYEQYREQILKNPVDIINGGFPCQAFSIAGEQKGFCDHRGELFYTFINLINQLSEKGYHKPRVILMENVKNLLNHDNGNTFKVIKKELELCGYHLEYKVFNTYKYTTLPQNRERIYILAFLNKRDMEIFCSLNEIPEVKNSKEDLVNSIKKIIDYSNSDYLNKYYYTKQKYPKYFETEGKDKINIAEDINEFYEFYQLRRGMYVRKNESGVCPTLTANMGTGGHNVPLIKTDKGIRKLTPAECFKLQGFRVGEEFSLPKITDSHLYKQAGNAVSVDVVELITNKLLRALVKADSEKE